MTIVAGLPLVILLVTLGGFWLRVALLGLSLAGLYEFYRALSKKVLAIHFSGYLVAVLYYLLVIGYGSLAYLLVILSAFMLLTFSMLVIFYQKISVQDSLITIGGFFYIPFLLSFIYFVREENIYFVWLIFISASASDTCAYLVGRTLGRHKLMGTPSPGKTWEGCVGGVLGAALVGLLYGHIVGGALSAVVISIMGAAFSQFGDLFASAIKRSAGIKDFGRILPGHGGVLDRFDSIIVTAPVVYMVMIGIGYLGI